MKISHKIISIPPYISTSWRNVLSLHTIEGGLLVITLADGDAVYIPDLTAEQTNHIFQAHTAYLEATEDHEEAAGKKERTTEAGNQFTAFIQSSLGGGEATGTQPFRMSFGNLENIQNALHHNPDQANGPDLPADMLEKVASIAKMITPDSSLLPQAEPHCNCFHCQIARSISGESKEQGPAGTEEEHEIGSADLQFQTWEIQQVGDKLFSVTNKLDHDEKYSVYLGEPVGCTCGRPGCEHIVAVLQS